MDAQTPIHPCFFMKTFLSATCDDALSGWARRYTDWHVGHCPRCAAALAALKALRSRLSALLSPPEPEEGLTEGRWARLEAAWAEADGTT